MRKDISQGVFNGLLNFTCLLIGIVEITKGNYLLGVMGIVLAFMGYFSFS